MSESLDSPRELDQAVVLLSRVANRPDIPPEIKEAIRQLGTAFIQTYTTTNGEPECSN